jgi:eukaryotic-like serine/threonine-protein kinase
MDTTLSPPTGQLLDDRYQVDSRLARGGMATVYLGRDTRLDRVVALKIAHQELARDAEFVRRFITEARAVARLSSPNVVAVFDQGAPGDVLYIAMEYVPGPTLREVLRARGSLSVQESLDVIEGVLGGLAAAHRAGIIHRDVKPENVLLGTDGVVKVADFGLARAAAAATHTKTGMIIGTAAYLAPEQVSASTSDARTDVYAAGVMLFEMLTGVQPHTGDSPLAVAYKHVNDVVPPPSTLVAGLPPALDALVALATSRDPDLRPADAGQFLDAITEVRNGGSVPSPRRGAHAAPAARDLAGAAGAAGAVGGAGLLAAPALGSGPGSAAGLHDPLADTDLSPAVGGSLSAGLAGLRAGDGLGGPDDGLGGRDRAPAHRGISGAGGARHAVGSRAAAGVRESVAGLLAAAGPPEDPDRAANHTLVVSAGTIVPGFGDAEFDDGRRRRPRQRGNGPDREPPLQKMLFSRRLIYILGGLALVLVAVLLIWWLSAGKYTNVPEVGGWSSGLARTELTGLGFKVHDGPSEHSNNVQRGHIIKTSPRPGSRIKNGSTITLTLSLGPLKIKVPSVTGVPIAQAQQELKSAGLTASTPKQTPSTTIAAGTVISTDPVAGTLWPKNKPVSITVSSGQPLPNFVGAQVAAAQAAAQAGGYQINPVPDSKNTEPANTITRQSPAPSTSIQPGEVVTVYFSQGPPQVAVPNVQGMKAGDATNALKAAGFNVAENKVGPGDRVISESPTGSQPQGTTITITVGFSFGGF